MNSSGPKTRYLHVQLLLVSTGTPFQDNAVRNLNFLLNLGETCTVSAFPFNPRFFPTRSPSWSLRTVIQQHTAAKRLKQTCMKHHGQELSFFFLNRCHHSYNNLLATSQEKWWAASSLEKVQENHRTAVLPAAKKHNIKARELVTCYSWTSDVNYNNNKHMASERGSQQVS